MCYLAAAIPFSVPGPHKKRKEKTYCRPRNGAPLKVLPGAEPSSAMLVGVCIQSVILWVLNEENLWKRGRNRASTHCLCNDNVQKRQCNKLRKLNIRGINCRLKRVNACNVYRGWQIYKNLFWALSVNRRPEDNMELSED